MRTPLPIDPLLAEIVSCLEQSQFLVVEAPPGAGKTTRLPRALFEANRDSPGQIVVTEPRRLAARLAAQHVALELGEGVGGVVGYSVRFDEQTSSRTRIRYVTEGLLLRQLLEAPELPFASAVILDEFHERHLESDLLLALLKRLAKTRRDLRIVVMSATLDAEPIAKFLSDCPCLKSEGRAYPLTVQHEASHDDRPLEKRAASAIRSLLSPKAAADTGNILVFLPGQREIQRLASHLSSSADLSSVALFPLHGSLPIQEQARAVAPSPQRKLVLATNVAESSVTVAGVTAVIDSGLARIAGFSTWSGRTTLETGEISQSSATQRAGRAGRVAPGQVLRLYSKGSFQNRRAQDLPEVQRLDLTGFVLTLAGLGIENPLSLDWLDAPPSTALHAAQELLSQLGALHSGQLSAVGKRMLRFPLAPRFAKLVCVGEEQGIADEACLAAALLSERDIRSQPGYQLTDLETGRSDVQERIDRFRDAGYDDFRARGVRALGLDSSRLPQVRRSYKQLTQRSRDLMTAPGTQEEVEVALRRALLSAFPDRVARRQQPGKRRLTLVNGSSADLSESSVARNDVLLLALDVEEQGASGRKHDARVRMASAIDADWLLDLSPNQVQATDSLVFNPHKQRVELQSRLAYGSITLEESRTAAPPSAEAARVLAEACKDKLARVFGKDSQVESTLERAAVLSKHVPEVGAFNTDHTLEGLLLVACQHVTSVEELSAIDYKGILLSDFSPVQQRALSADVPESVTLPGGRRLDVHYERGRPPWIASRLQDFFGMRAGPTICRGRLPLVLHLLAPNQRAVQVTADLPGFWSRHYSEIRKELRRRYPRHPWPEDGRSATPPEPRPPRRPRKK